MDGPIPVPVLMAKLVTLIPHLKAYESFSLKDPLKSNKALESRVWLQPTKQKDRQSFNIDSARDVPSGNGRNPEAPGSSFFT